MAEESTKVPGKAHREDITLIELTRMFPDEEVATKWFEATIWGKRKNMSNNKRTTGWI